MRRWFVNYENLASTGVVNERTIAWLLKHNFQEVDKNEYERVRDIVRNDIIEKLNKN